MRLLDTNWAIMRGALITMLFSVLASAGLIGGSMYYKQAMDEDYRQQHRRYLSMSGKYLTVDEEERTIQSYYPLYQRMQDEGIIGDEQRLGWLGSLRAAAEKVDLPSMRYEISARSPYTPDFPVDLGIFHLFASDLTLTLGLFHEGDLISVLDELEGSTPGLFRVGECGMQRAHKGIQHNPEVANITAKCKLRWLTLRPKGAAS